MWDMESFLCNILLSFPLKHLPGWVLRREFPLPGHTVAACLFTLDQRWLGDMEASRDKRLRVRGLDCTGPSVLAGFPTTFSAFVCPSQFVPPNPPTTPALPRYWWQALRAVPSCPWPLPPCPSSRGLGGLLIALPLLTPAGDVSMSVGPVLFMHAGSLYWEWPLLHGPMVLKCNCGQRGPLSRFPPARVGWLCCPSSGLWTS